MNPLRRPLGRAAAFARREAMAKGALLILVLLAWGFLKIADDVTEGETQAFDLSVLLALRASGAPNDPIGPDWLTTAAVDLTSLGSIAVLSLIVLVIGGLFVSLGHRRQATILLVASVGGLIWSQSLKAIVGRARPDEMFRVVEAVNASFPSGHATLSACIYLTLGALVASFAKGRTVRMFALAAAGAITVLVGVSRVYLGVHWLSDVLAGWCLGGAWALVCWLGLWVWDGRWRREAAI